ncbi:MAG: ribonuclease III [Deltaproteobacteria bacterium]|nr:ribonuclease III [Deltaproteobacteria bacterium]
MADERLPALRELERRLAHRFYDIGLLERALIHRSYVYENPYLIGYDNERLEFLGDAVLGLCISDFLMRRFPDRAEGPLSRMRGFIVSEKVLADVALRLRLGDYLFLGRGEAASGGRMKASLLADALEAVLAALYLDAGFEKARARIGELFAPLIEAGLHDETFGDYKTDLQRASQTLFGEIPRYVLVDESGPDHEKRFEVRISLPEGITATGTGRSKKEAEQDAARRAMDILRNCRKSIPGGCP